MTVVAPGIRLIQGVMKCRLIIYGEPAPQGSKRHVGGGVMIESSKKVAPWRQDVVAAIKQSEYGNSPLFDGALILKMVFTVNKPASKPKRRMSWPNTKPDLSKLARSTEDALVTAGLIKDDARIVGYDRLYKVYPNEDLDALSSSGCLIEIRSLTECVK